MARTIGVWGLVGGIGIGSWLGCGSDSDEVAPMSDVLMEGAAPGGTVRTGAAGAGTGPEAAAAADAGAASGAVAEGNAAAGATGNAAADASASKGATPAADADTNASKGTTPAADAAATASGAADAGDAGAPASGEPATPIAIGCSALELRADDGTFLGEATSFITADSVCNPAGDHGNTLSPTSIFNPAGDFGSSFGADSAFADFSTTPPRLFCTSTGAALAPVTKNSTLLNAIDPEELCEVLAANNL